MGGRVSTLTGCPSTAFMAQGRRLSWLKGTAFALRRQRVEAAGAFVMQVMSRGLTAAIPMENPYCSCELTRAYSCNPYGESLLQLRANTCSRPPRAP